VISPIERLLAIEEIKRVKSKYFYYFDHKDWESWKREVFAPDLVFHVPDIEILTPTTAKGIWAMEDILRHPEGQRSSHGFSFLHGFGHYHETYVRTAHGWRIQSVRLTRLYVEQH